MKHRKVPGWVRTIDRLLAGSPLFTEVTAMRETTEKTPFPLPPREGAMTQWPEAVPWTVPIAQMSEWWLEITCSCDNNVTQLPLRRLSAQIGWRRTLRDIVPFLRCRRCGRRGHANVALVDGAGGDAGRFGAKTRRHHLYP